MLQCKIHKDTQEPCGDNSNKLFRKTSFFSLTLSKFCISSVRSLKGKTERLSCLGKEEYPNLQDMIMLWAAEHTFT